MTVAVKLVFSVKHTVVHILGDYPLDQMRRLFEESKQELIDELSKDFQGLNRELLSVETEVVELVGDRT